MVLVDDIVLWGQNAAELIRLLEAVPTHLEDRGLFVAAHKTVCSGEDTR